MKAFITAAETASFSQAAECLYLTQPAISKRIASLEQKLGSHLFDRIGRRVILTEAGNKLLPRARQVLLELSDIQRSILSQSGDVSGVLTMGTSHHIGLHRLPPVLKQYSRRYPAVKLDIRFMDSETACAAVEQGALELAIVTLPPEPIPQLELQQVWKDRLVFVAASDHPLALRKQLRLSDLTQYPAVLAATGTYTREILEKAMRPSNLKLQVGMATNYLETLKMMTAIGLGWSLLPETMTAEGDLKRLRVQSPRLHRSLGVVRHRGRTLSNAARMMVENCLDYAD